MRTAQRFLFCSLLVWCSHFYPWCSQRPALGQTDVELDLRLLVDQLPDGGAPGSMLQDSLLNSANTFFEQWRTRYDQLSDPQQIQEYQLRIRQQFLQQIGGLPADTPLRPQITGRISRSGYSVEKVLFDSQPNFFVTAALFLPDWDRYSPPWPAVVVLCGHAAEGKLQDGYQRAAALAALNGLAAMVVDPIGQGERRQILEADAPSLSPTVEHTLVGTAAIPLGWNTARWMIHDGMRAMDYLQSRPDIQADRLGVMGNSGGGTQTSYLMALDERVLAAAPSCYLTTFQKLLNTIGPQDAEQNIHGQIAWGMDHADFVLMRAPRPTLISCATQDYFDIQGTWTTYRDAKRFYERVGAGRAVEIVEVDAAHGWHPSLRRASVQFMCQHLAGRLTPIDDPEVQPLSSDEMQVTSQGQVLRIAGAVSVFDHIREESQRLGAVRLEARPAASELVDRVRQLAGIRPLEQIPRPEQISVPHEIKQSFTRHPLADRALLEPVLLKAERGIWLPGVLASPIESSGDHQQSNSKSIHANPVCLLFETGFREAVHTGGEVERRIASGQIVLAVDIRGIGETEPVGKYWYNQRFGRNGGNAMLAYLQGQSLVGLRAEDCLVVCRWLSERVGGGKVDVVANGELTVAAMHAGALEPSLIDRLEIRQGLNSWTDLSRAPLLENQICNVVHGALQVYDLPDLSSVMGHRLIVTLPQPPEAKAPQ